jgi:hypothetical protein
MEACSIAARGERSLVIAFNITKSCIVGYRTAADSPLDGEGQ